MKPEQARSLLIKISLALLLTVTLLSCPSGSRKQSLATLPEETGNVIYKDPSAPIEERVEDLLSRMTTEEKIGQMTQVVFYKLSGGDVKNYLLGSALSGGGGSPWNNNTLKGWCDMQQKLQKEAMSTRLGIPLVYGTDSVHGHNNLANATIFPHNIGIGAAGDADLSERIGRAAALETSATGVPWTFAPCVAVGRDPRWGRFYESYGQDPALVSRLGAAFIRGYMSAETGTAKPLTTAKHFLGDGGTVWGSSTTGNYKIDQGNTIGDETYLRKVLLPPYAEAVKAGTRSVMVSFSSWNGLKMHAQKALITDLLKGELGFTGFVVSDWAGMDQIDNDYYKAIVTGINAGIDMNMVPENGPRFISVMKKAVEKKDISMDRIDDAVRRILRVKFEMGLFENPYPNRDLAVHVRSAEHLALAREAVAKSQVVLVNRKALPIPASGSKIYVAGSAANDIGMQCGGWTMTWQGAPGAITKGTTILEGIMEVAGKDRVVFDAGGNFPSVEKDSTCIIVTGENPYAEGVGDNGTISIKTYDSGIFQSLRPRFSKIILVVVSGRPLVLGDIANEADGIVAAWLPGTEGAGVADILFGRVKPTGRLPFDWLKSVDQLPIDRFISGEQKPLWPVGYGLTY